MSPRGLSSDVQGDRMTLASPTQVSRTFDPASVAELPEAVQRWLRHALPTGAQLTTRAEVRMHGQIRLGRWRAFAAVQRITSTDGFVWAATARLLGLPVVGFDRYTRGSGEMRWRLLNAIPVLRADGPNVTRGAAGRYAGELFLYLPTAALSETIHWRAVDNDRATAQVQVGSMTPVDVTITVASTGALADLVLPRWGNPGGAPYAEYSFRRRVR